jgi:hypothetical protein
MSSTRKRLNSKSKSLLSKTLWKRSMKRSIELPTPLSLLVNRELSPTNIVVRSNSAIFTATKGRNIATNFREKKRNVIPTRRKENADPSFQTPASPAKYEHTPVTRRALD